MQTHQEFLQMIEAVDKANKRKERRRMLHNVATILLFAPVLCYITYMLCYTYAFEIVDVLRMIR